jgi:hypothetical protein
MTRAYFLPLHERVHLVQRRGDWAFNIQRFPAASMQWKMTLLHL